ncbi:MAG: hypothetical protein HYW49_10040 [Deltaproteobacteria bacterium]|nr:hypothetical protein [Deltaproteobacteria bacterium]
MKKSSAALLGVLGISALSAMLTACDYAQAPPEVLSAAISIKFDPALTYSEKQMVIGDINAMTRFKLQFLPKSYFAHVFGGTSASNVIDFLDARINYIIPQSADLEARLRMGTIYKSLGDESGASKPAEAFTMATNIGMVLWLEREANRPHEIRFTFGDAMIPLDSSRIGIVQLGEGYTNPKFELVARTGTLVHEARHSDCTGGLTKADIARLKQGELPEKRTCGHMHVTCPAKHAMHGLAACDDHMWGAYAVGAMYENALSSEKTCLNCDEETLAIAKMAAFDSLSRILVIKDFMSGKAGLPDMSSSGVIDTDLLRAKLAAFKQKRAASPHKNGITRVR